MSDNDYTDRHLTPAQKRALSAMASGATKSQAGILANRSVRTIDRWLKQSPEFQAAIQSATDSAVDDAERRLAGMLDDALSAMYSVMMSPESPPHVVLRAADLLMANHKRMREFNELSDRVKQLEEKIGNVRY